MSEHEVGPIGHMLQEVGAGNPGAAHLLEELVEVKRRLREYEGMMTRREVLERLQHFFAEHFVTDCPLDESLCVRWPNPPKCCVFRDPEYGDTWRAPTQEQASWCWLYKALGGDEDAAHELALLMHAEREEAKP